MNSFAKGRDIMAHDAKIARRVRRKIEEVNHRAAGGSLLDDPVEGYVDEVLKPLYDKITELNQENAKLREALRQLREPPLCCCLEREGDNLNCPVHYPKVSEKS